MTSSPHELCPKLHLKLRLPRQSHPTKAGLELPPIPTSTFDVECLLTSPPPPKTSSGASSGALSNPPDPSPLQSVAQVSDTGQWRRSVAQVSGAGVPACDLPLPAILRELHREPRRFPQFPNFDVECSMLDISLLLLLPPQSLPTSARCMLNAARFPNPSPAILRTQSCKESVTSQ